MQLNFNKLNGIIPAIIQDNITGKVLMLGFMNEEALKKTTESGLVTFFSRTKKRLWTKGEESGNYFKTVDILEDCDSDTLLIKVIPSGPACHTGNDTCFNEENKQCLSEGFLEELQQLIHTRKSEMPDNSYTTKLFTKGINKIAQKVGEEAIELIIEAKDHNKELLLNEAADLLYHILVLLSAKNSDLSDVVKVLKDRHQLKLRQ